MSTKPSKKTKLLKQTGTRADKAPRVPVVGSALPVGE
jgi:hypothetical protein